MSNNDLLINLENQISKLLKELNLRNEKIDELKAELNRLNDRLKKTQTELKLTQDKNNELRVISGLSGNKEHRRLMKLKLNSLVKEVDICIAGLKNNSV